MAYIKEFVKLKPVYQKLLDYCLMTTNLPEKTEAILRTIRRAPGITQKQWEALNNIAIQCAEIPEWDPRKILHKAKFDEPVSKELPDGPSPTTTNTSDLGVQEQSNSSAPDGSGG